MKVVVLPTPTGLGFTVGFAEFGQPVTVQANVSPLNFGPILLTNASLAPARLACNGVMLVTAGSEVCGKLAEAVSPAT